MPDDSINAGSSFAWSVLLSYLTLVLALVSGILLFRHVNSHFGVAGVALWATAGSVTTIVSHLLIPLAPALTLSDSATSSVWIGNRFGVLIRTIVAAIIISIIAFFCINHAPALRQEILYNSDLSRFTVLVSATWTLLAVRVFFAATNIRSNQLWKNQTASSICNTLLIAIMLHYSELLTTMELLGVALLALASLECIMVGVFSLAIGARVAQYPPVTNPEFSLFRKYSCLLALSTFGIILNEGGMILLLLLGSTESLATFGIAKKLYEIVQTVTLQVLDPVFAQAALWARHGISAAKSYCRLYDTGTMVGLTAFLLAVVPLISFGDSILRFWLNSVYPQALTCFVILCLPLPFSLARNISYQIELGHRYFIGPLIQSGKFVVVFALSSILLYRAGGILGLACAGLLTSVILDPFYLAGRFRAYNKCVLNWGCNVLAPLLKPFLLQLCSVFTLLLFFSLHDWTQLLLAVIIPNIVFLAIFLRNRRARTALMEIFLRHS